MTQLRIPAHGRGEGAEVLVDRPAPEVGAAGFELEFIAGLPGFPRLHRFAIVPLPEGLEPFSRMRCLERDDLEFIVVPPGVVFPEYVVEIDADSVDRLELRQEDALVLVIVTLTESGAVPTANLLGPIVINRANRRAMQVIQHGSGHGVSVPLDVPPEASSSAP